MPSSYDRARAAGRPLLLYVCFVASGAASLVLQIVWSKYLSLLLGNSIYGVSTVVAAYMGGLGLGAYVGGRLADRVREPLLAYAAVELVVAVMAFASPLAYLVARPVFDALYASFGGGGMVFLLLRFAILFAVLLVPTVAMGATLPLLIADRARRGSAFTSSVGDLYAFNTAGAVLGVLGAGYLLIPALGLWRTAVLAGLLDVAVAGAMLRWRPAAAPASARPIVPDVASPPARFAGWIVPLFGISGFTAILYEVAWTRILTVPFGGMVYAFSSILAVYLLGIALGSALIARASWLRRKPILLFGTLEIGVAAAIAGGSHLFALLPRWQADLIVASGGGSLRFFLGEAGLAALVVLPATLLLGALFPTAAAVYRAGSKKAGESVGAIYAANTIGSILGALATGFALIPAFGSFGAILLGALANLTIGLLALLCAELRPVERAGSALAVVAASCVIALAALPEWKPLRTTLGLSTLLRTFRVSGERGLEELVGAHERADGPYQLRFYREGRRASVAVVETRSVLSLIVNGKVDASEGEDMITQAMLGHLPLLLLPDAQSVAIVGYGAGVTTHAALTHPVRETVTIELEEAVIEAAPLFRDVARDPLADPRHRFVIEDAGTFLRSTAGRFDVIISEPSNPWLAGVGDLFTREFYRAVSARLEPGGIFCQWVQSYELSPRTLATILRTLAASFPSGHVFRFGADFLIISSASPSLPIDLEKLARGFARTEVRRDLTKIGLRAPKDLLRAYRGRLERLAEEAGPGPINSDDNGWLEHAAPLDLLRSGAPAKLKWTRETGVDLAQAIGGEPSLASRTLVAAANDALARADPGAARGMADALAALGSHDASSIKRRASLLESRKRTRDARRSR